MQRSKKKCPESIKLNRKKENERIYFNKEIVDLPDALVEAHLAAYAYLNPNISKYEDLLGLLDHAAKSPCNP